MLAYLLALAPVLPPGRASFSSYMALADSAVHMIGADYLIRHGQHFAHLDLRSSYGQFINDYYNGSYPSGADTLFGGSAFLLGLPLIWAFQPFNAFVLATAAGARMAARPPPRARWRVGGARRSSARPCPALVYAYELLGSIKELTALVMILTLGALVVEHRRWRARRAGARDPVRARARRRHLRARPGVRRMGARRRLILLAVLAGSCARAASTRPRCCARSARRR